MYLKSLSPTFQVVKASGSQVDKANQLTLTVLLWINIIFKQAGNCFKPQCKMISANILFTEASERLYSEVSACRGNIINNMEIINLERPEEYS